MTTVDRTRSGVRAHHDELVQCARSHIGLLERNARDADARRSIPAVTIEALRADGLLRLLTPTRYGGLESSFETQIAVTSELARGCASTAWVAMILTGVGWLASLFPDEALDEVFGADTDAAVAGVLTPSAQIVRKPGGYQVSGRWSFASGCHHASWAALATPRTDECDHGLALIPMSSLTIEDTWHTVGMRGTGSDTIVGSDIFVPDHRFLPLDAALAGELPSQNGSSALYRCSIPAQGTLVLAGPMLGMARAALDYVIERAHTRGVTYTIYERQIDAPTVQIAVAEAASALDTAQLHIARGVDDMASAAEAGSKPDYITRARIRMDTGVAVRNCREAIRTLCSAHGSAAFADQSPLGRIARDIETASRHALVGPELSTEIYGRALLGVEPRITELV